VSVKRFRQGKRRVLKDLRIDEISAVDFPAQHGARAVLTKRRDVRPSENGSDVDKCDGPSYSSRRIVLITTEEKGHSHAISIYSGDRGGTTSYGRIPSTIQQEDHNHPWTMDADGTITIGSNDGHTHGINQETFVQSILALVKRVAKNGGEPFDLDPALSVLVDSASQPKQQPPMSTTPPTQPQTGEVENLRKELELAKKLAELNDAQRAYRKKLAEPEASAFLAKDAAGRQAAVDAEARKSAEADPILYTSPITKRDYRKSAGEEVIELAKRADAAETLAKQKDELAAEASFEKRADSHLAKFQGELKVRAAIVKAIDGIPDEATRKAAHESLAAANAAMSGVFEKRGLIGSGAPVADKQAAVAKLDALAKARAAEKSVDYFTAYDDVKKANPELHRLAVSGAA